jgi:regulator of sigma E protease
MFDLLLQSDALSAIVAFVLVLIPAVIIHEMGHFLAAKLVGITILEFGIGLPPRLVKLFTYKGTDYTLNWIPLGGFVRPLGEDVVRQMGAEATEQDRREAEARGIKRAMSVSEAPARSRILFLAGGALANFLMAFVLFALIALIGLPTIVGGRANVLYVQPSSLLAQAGLQNLDAVESINGETFLFSSELIDRLYELSGQTVTLTVRRADEPEARTITVDLPPLSGSAHEDAYPMIVGVVQDAPAGQAGLMPLDVITAFNGTPVHSNEALRDLTLEKRGEEVVLTVQRGGETLEVPIVPRISYPSDQGAMGIQLSGALASIDQTLGLIYQDGAPQQAVVSMSLIDSLRYAWMRMTDVMNTVLSVPAQIINGSASGEDLRLASIVGISQVGGLFLQESIQRSQPTIIIEYIALISLVLGLTNLLPIPALDGGRILFVLIELLRGRPIAPEREGMVHLVGLALLLSLMVVVMLNDIVNPLTDLIR